ncbi:MAG: ferrous iron transport protein B [Candidatus Bathyarchaeia archaeon]|nr:ferrous iron transport protein B [Candidatus Bathyarchaeota archaeon]
MSYYKGKNKKTQYDFTIVLAGNANVGKSVIFNQLTGLNQIIGNWPGKTVEKAEGFLYFKGYKIKILDLPGIYSLSAFSIEEIIARDYIAIEKPDIIINVLDASALERNLYLTLQLFELNVPIVIALNQIDLASKKGIKINYEKLSEVLGVPVVPTIAITGSGIKELIDKVIQVFEGKIKLKPLKIAYCKEVEEAIQKLENKIKINIPELTIKYPARWLAIKLLEKDEDIEDKVKSFPNGEKILSLASMLNESLEEKYGKETPVLLAMERYGLANEVVKASAKFTPIPKISFEEKLDELTGHKILGYIFLSLIFGSTFIIVFGIGNYLVDILENFFGYLTPSLNRLASFIVKNIIVESILNGVFSGVIAGLTIVLPYILPFYFILSILEDSGYLPRAAFLLDSLMHKIGLHGKAAICLFLGYGCNVPACIGCRIMESERERFLGGFLTVLVPCAARSVVILGLVGKYLGFSAALSLYVINVILIFLLGRLGHKVLLGEAIGLIMEIPPYKTPSIKTILKKTWNKTKDFIYFAFPIIISGTILLEVMRTLNLLASFAVFMKPLIVDWLGLPLLTGIPLVLGVLRKELALILLSEELGTLNFNEVLTPIQMYTFSLVVMVYIPCLSTIATLWREFGFKKALLTSIIYVSLALFIGGLTYRILSFLSLMV